MIKALTGKRSWLFAALPVVFLIGVAIFAPIAMVVVILHLILVWALCDLVGYVVQKLRKQSFKRYYQGAFAILLTAVYLAMGWYNAHHIVQTNYTFQTEKLLGRDSLRIVLIADSHLGEVLTSEKFVEELKNIQAAQPDLVVICGDYVDDDTTKADILLATKALGELESTYGTYYVFGNHDKGYMRSRDFTADELRSTLTENGITILQDDALLIDDSFYLIGRQDRSEHSRASIAELTADLDPSKYTVVLNHQPNDYDNEAASGVDLVLSGHTHGGHIFPVGEIGLLIGANDKIYGAEQREKTNFVVTSGISGWGVPFKTFAISEYVVIDIVQE